VSYQFEWDPSKAASNLRKHGVSFEEAVTVFADPLSLDMADPSHSVEEARFIVLGSSRNGNVLVVTYERNGPNPNHQRT
jgi:uncharacterized DUF497 family protein